MHEIVTIGSDMKDGLIVLPKKKVPWYAVVQTLPRLNLWIIIRQLMRMQTTFLEHYQSLRASYYTESCNDDSLICRLSFFSHSYNQLNWTSVRLDFCKSLIESCDPSSKILKKNTKIGQIMEFLI